jgi:hypothetical protein
MFVQAVRYATTDVKRMADFPSKHHSLHLKVRLN